MPDPKPDGGPAFPLGTCTEGNLHEQPGMSLRDWFAGQAIAGLSAGSCNWTASTPGVKSVKDAQQNLAAFAYQVADALLAEREK